MVWGGHLVVGAGIPDLQFLDQLSELLLVHVFDLKESSKVSDTPNAS